MRGLLVSEGVIYVNSNHRVNITKTERCVLEHDWTRTSPYLLNNLFTNTATFERYPGEEIGGSEDDEAGINDKSASSLDAHPHKGSERLTTVLVAAEAARGGFCCHACLSFNCASKEALLESLHLKLLPGQRAGESLLCGKCSDRITNVRARSTKGTLGQIWEKNKQYNLMFKLNPNPAPKIFSLWEIELKLSNEGEWE